MRAFALTLHWLYFNGKPVLQCKCNLCEWVVTGFTANHVSIHCNFLLLQWGPFPSDLIAENEIVKEDHAFTRAPVVKRAPPFTRIFRLYPGLLKLYFWREGWFNFQASNWMDRTMEWTNIALLSYANRHGKEGEADVNPLSEQTG